MMWNSRLKEASRILQPVLGDLQDSTTKKNSTPLTVGNIETLDRKIELSNGTICQVLSSWPPRFQPRRSAAQPSSSPSAASPPPPSGSGNGGGQTRPTFPPLVFLHGTFHGAWCWQEHFFPFFVSLGYCVIALSWQGTSETYKSGEDRDEASGGIRGKKEKKKKKKLKISEHVSDLEEVMEKVPEILHFGRDQEEGPGDSALMAMKPILIGHSFGGIIAMKYFETLHARDKKDPSKVVSGIIAMCSVPPSGLNPMIKRSMWKSLGHTWKVIKGIPMKKATTDPVLCRYLFFGGEEGRDKDDKKQNEKEKEGGDHEEEEEEHTNPSGTTSGITDEELARYQDHFQRDSKSVIDVGDLARSVPSMKADENGLAPFLASRIVDGLESPPPVPILVLGANDDRIVDFQGTLETARYYGLRQEADVVMVDSPHDVMLGRHWRNAADVIHRWVETTINTSG